MTATGLSRALFSTSYWSSSDAPPPWLVSRTRIKRFRLFLFAHRTRAHHRNDSSRGELAGETVHGIFRESVENQRRIDGLQIIGEILRGRGKRSGIPRTSRLASSSRGASSRG